MASGGASIRGKSVTLSQSARYVQPYGVKVLPTAATTYGHQVSAKINLDDVLLYDHSETTKGGSVAPQVTLEYFVGEGSEPVQSRVGAGWKIEIGVEDSEQVFLVDHFRYFTKLDTEGDGPPTVKRSIPSLSCPSLAV